MLRQDVQLYTALSAQDACFFFHSGVCEKRFPLYLVLRTILRPFPVSSMLKGWWCKYACAKRESFFARRHATPLFTAPTLKNGGKGCKTFSNPMSMGTYFRRHRYIGKGRWVCRVRATFVGMCARSCSACEKAFHVSVHVCAGP